MPTFVVTMERLDRRTIVVEAKDLDAAKDKAVEEFRFAEEDPFKDETHVVAAEEVCMLCRQEFDETPEGQHAMKNPDLCALCAKEYDE